MTLQGSIGLSMVPPGPPDSYLGVAFAVVKAVRVLADTRPTPSIPLAMLAAHCLECALKAYLSKDGSDAIVRGVNVRHDLGALWSMAQVAGLAVAAPPPAWVLMLGDVHGAPYYLRYLTGVHGLSLPPAEPMATELEAVLQLVRRGIRGGPAEA